MISPLRRRDAVVAVAAVVSVIGQVTWAWQSGVVPVTDSPRYLPGSSSMNLLGQNAFGDTPAGFLTQAFYWVVPYSAIPTSQALVSAAAWGVLALAVLRLVVGRPGTALALMTVAYSWLPAVRGWTVVPAPESLTISSFALWMAATLLGSHRSSTGRFGVMAAALLAVPPLLLRPQLVVVLAPTTGLLLATRWREVGTATRIAASSVLAAVSTWAMWILVSVAQDPGLTRWYTLTNTVFRPGFRGAAYPDGFGCAALDSAVDSQQWSSVYELLPQLPSACPDVSASLADALPPGVVWATSDPWGMASALVRDLPWLLSGSEPSGRDSLAPAWVVVLCCLAAGVALALWIKRRFAGPGRPFQVRLLIPALSTAAFLVLVWAADGMDVARHGIPISTVLPWAAVCLPSIWVTASGRSEDARTRSDSRHGRLPRAVTDLRLASRRIASALLLAVTGALLVASYALLPVPRLHAQVDWRPTTSDASTPLLLAAEIPQRLTVSVPCTTVRVATAPGSPTLLFSSSSDPSRRPLRLLATPSRVWVQIAFQDVPALSLPLPLTSRPGCEVAVDYRREAQTIRLDVADRTSTAPAIWREPLSLAAVREGVEVSGLHSDVVSPQGLRATVVTQPSALPLRDYRLILVGLGVGASLVAIRLCVAWRPTRRRVPKRRAGGAGRQLTPVDLGVGSAILVGAAVVPPVYDDGWVMATVRAFRDLGYFSNYFANQAAPQPIGFWWAWLEHFWLSLTALPFVALRLFSVALLLLTWYLLSRRLLPLVSERQLRPLLTSISAVVFVLGSWAWLLSLRPEPLIAALLTAQLLAVLAFMRAPSAAGLATMLAIAGAAFAAHQSGVVVVTAMLVTGPAVIAWLRAGDRDRIGGAGVILLATVTVTFVLLVARLDLEAWTSARNAFSDELGYGNFLNEIERLAGLNRLLVNPVRRISAALILLGALFFLARPRRSRHDPVTVLGFASLLGIAGLALTASKWAWHFGAVVPAGVVLIATSASWLFGLNQGPRNRVRSAVLVGAVAAAGYWASQSREPWSVFEAPSVTDVERFDRLLPLGGLLTSLAWWGLLCLVGCLLLWFGPPEPRRMARVAALTLLAAAVSVVTLSLTPLLVDLARSGQSSWIGQTTSVAAGNMCGDAGSTGFRVPTAVSPLPQRTVPEDSPTAVAAEPVDASATPDLPFPNLLVFRTPPVPDAATPVATPWNLVSAGQEARSWVWSPGNTAMALTVESRYVGRQEAVQAEPLAWLPGPRAWRLVTIPAVGDDRLLRLTWSPATAGFPFASGFVTPTSASTVMDRWDSGWANPGTYPFTPCLRLPSIRNGLISDFTVSINVPELSGRSIFWEKTMTELDCIGSALSAERRCVFSLAADVEKPVSVQEVWS